MSLKVELTSKAQSKVWEGKKVSYSDDMAYVYLSNKDTLDIQEAAKSIRAAGFKEVKLVGNEWDFEASWFFYQGFFTAKQDFKLEFTKELESNEGLKALVECSTFMRTLINEPSDDLIPEVLVNKVAHFVQEQAAIAGCEKDLTVKIISNNSLLEEGYAGTYTVGKSSNIHKPAVLELDFNPTQDPEAEVFATLIGKGITFDTGGYSLKPSNGMMNMRTDMGGSALVGASLGYAIRTGLNKRVKLFICSAENMVSEQAMKLGDIIRYANGKTVEILNTDAEGRLVLADALIKASSIKPKYIIDCATLTGAAKIALGNDYHAVLSYDNEATYEFLTVSEETNEPFWRLPLAKIHTSVMSSNYADMANIATSAAGGVAAGASTAAGFLAAFVENKKGWIHIDAAATFRAAGAKQWGVGATGLGMRTIATFLCAK